METVQTIGIKATIIPFSFQLNGVSTPLAAQGLGVSFARSDTGLWTGTLAAGCPSTSCVFVAPWVKGAKGGGSTSGLYLEPYGSPESGTFGIRIMNAGTTTLVDPAASTTALVSGVVFVAAAGTRSRNV
jgi:hypothetical protein